MYVHHLELTSKYGCPNFYDKSQTIYQAQAFCWCGLDYPLGALAANTSLQPQLADAAEAIKEDSADPDEEEDNTNVRDLLNKRAAAGRRRKGGPSPPPGTPDKACHNKKDGRHLKDKGKTTVQNMMKACAKECTNVEGCNATVGQACMEAKLDVSLKCSYCFGMFIQCSDDNCIEECECGSSQVCDDCNKLHCKPEFDHCSGLGGHDTSSVLRARADVAASSTNEVEFSIVTV